jgi:hypothetical protein
MADQVQEILNIPREFFKDGMQFINRSQKRESTVASLVRKPLSIAAAC